MRKNIFKPVFAAALAAALISGCGKSSDASAETVKEMAGETALAETEALSSAEAAETSAGETDALSGPSADHPEEGAGKPETPPEKPENTGSPPRPNSR